MLLFPFFFKLGREKEIHSRSALIGEWLSLNDLALGIRFLSGLPRFLHGQVDGVSAARIIQDRLRSREQTFLDLARKVLFGRPDSPYRPLLDRSGCRYGDLERMVRGDGLEQALIRLFQEGVYLSVEEYKGRREVIRGSCRFRVNPQILRNPFSRIQVPVQSSGSRSARTPILIGLDHIAACAVNTCHFLHLHGGDDWEMADWEVPGGGALFRLLKFSRWGRRPVRWFSHIDPSSPGLHPRYRWSARWLRWGSFMSGAPLPGIQHVSVEDPLPIARWITAVLARNKTPLLFTFPSSALRLTEAARRAGFDLAGAKFLVGGEPITSTRLEIVKGAGAELFPRYGSIECGPIGYGCFRPRHPDEVHLHQDLFALIQAGQAGKEAGLPPRALLITTLAPSAPFIFINVSLGDEAEMDDRPCGCSLERGGLGLRLHTIRSFEKLTGGGMTFFDADIIRILEDVLPSRFGGSATDFQLLEQESGLGESVLYLLVHPRLGPLDNTKVAKVFLESVSAGDGVSRVMGLNWQALNLLRVERRPPVSTASGKILHWAVQKPRP